MIHPGTVTSPPATDSCWDLAIAAAAHHVGGGQLSPDPVNHEIFQVSTITALMDGVLDGDTRYSEVMRHGDFGVGTFNSLDGEMAAVDGDFYQLYGDGSIALVDPAELTPFAAVTFFRGDAAIEVTEPTSHDDLLALIDSTVPSENLFYAIRIDATFSLMTTRTVTRQDKPYPSFAQAAGNQVERTVTNVSGTIVGFRAPRYVQGITVAGYHLHFVAADRKSGGHVLNFAVESGTVQIDQDTDIHLEMPTSPLFLGTHLSTEGIAEQIEAAENKSQAD